MYPAGRLAELAGGRVDVRILEDCDHLYTGREKELGGVVACHLHRHGRTVGPMGERAPQPARLRQPASPGSVALGTQRAPKPWPPRSRS
jgi:hypothetical protein